MVLGKITSLYSDAEKTEALFPRTKTKAISDDNGVGLDAIMEHLAYADTESADVATAPTNVDTFGGRTPEEYVLATDMSSSVGNLQSQINQKAAAPKNVNGTLSSKGWYRIGTLYVGHESGHTASARVCIGGWFNDQNALPAIFDIAFQLNGGYIHKVFDTLGGSHFSNIRLCRINSRTIAIDLYYSANGANYTYITVYETQGAFNANSGYVSVQEGAEPVIASQSLNECQNTHSYVLWENASRSSFPPQTISLDLTGYNYIAVQTISGEYDMSAIATTFIPAIAGYGANCTNFGIGGDAWAHCRHVFVRENGVEFGSGNQMQVNTGNMYPDWNGRAIPYRILGIKGVL